MKEFRPISRVLFMYQSLGNEEKDRMVGNVNLERTGCNKMDG